MKIEHVLWKSSGVLLEILASAKVPLLFLISVVLIFDLLAIIEDQYNEKTREPVTDQRVLLMFNQLKEKAA